MAEAKGVEIELVQSHPQDSRIRIDGMDVTRLVRSFTLTARAGELPCLTLEVLPKEVWLRADAEVQAVIQQLGAPEGKESRDA